MAVLKIVEENTADHYSDGDLVEKEILEYVENNPSGDYSSVLNQDQRWPVFYHLTDMRENILNWYDFAPDCDVLEIGAGMGAITGLLCRKAGTVTSVELTLPRARVIQERCRQYDNLTILVGNFNRMEFPRKYDYITLIGVLEYAPGFTESGDPADFLRRIRTLLKPDGKLLIAIENRFGLKYWCGAKEDHTGKPFSGINGYPENPQVCTWSRSDLSELLCSCGFEKQKFFYPLPDYKLPQVLYSDEYYPQDHLPGKIRMYRSNKEPSLAVEEKISDAVLQNGAFPFMANSFFVECGSEDVELSQVSAAFFSPDRISSKQIITVIDLNRMTVEKRAANPSAKSHLQDIMETQNYYRGKNLEPYVRNGDRLCMPYIKGEPLEKIIYRHLSRGELDEAKSWIDRFYECVLASSERNTAEGDLVLSSGFMDMVFQNCFVRDGKMVFYDQEWLEKDVPALFILFRAILVFYSNNPELQNVVPIHDLFSLYALDGEKLNEYANREKAFSQSVIQQQGNAISILGSYCSGGIPLQLNELISAYQEKPVLLQKMAETQNTLAETQYAYDVISNAFFWKITKPMRILVDDLYRYPVFLQSVKVLKSLKNEGVRGTGEKVKRKITALKDNRHDPDNSALQWEFGNVPAPDNRIKFSILVPLYNTSAVFLKALIQSVLNQQYSNWELCLADSSDEEHTYVEEICREYMKADARILYRKLPENLGISGNTNECAKMAGGDYLALLDHDDLLSPAALSSNAIAIAQTEADVLYSDEDHLSAEGRHVYPFYKPDWSPDLLHSQMYICHFLVFKKSLFEHVGGFRSEYDGSQDYDLMLRFSEVTKNIYHIPQILYSWRESETSTASSENAKPYAHEAGRKALDAHLKRVYGNSAYAQDGEYTFTYDARFPLTENPMVSIVIPMRDKLELTDPCVRSIIEKSTYQNFEILILDNRSVQDETKRWAQRIPFFDQRIRVIPADMDFNWSALNNLGAKQAKGDVLVFLNNDTIVISEDWIERLAENACRDEVGMVGGLLLYPDDTIQHAGVVVGMNDWADHVFKGMEPIHYGSPFVSPVLSRNVTAVTGACLAISRERFEELGGFDEGFIICGSDVELGIRACRKGYFNLYNAHVRLYHFESKSRDSYIPEIDYKKSEEAYKPYRKHGDPFYNINLNLESVIPAVRRMPMKEFSLFNLKQKIKQHPLGRVMIAARHELSNGTDYRIPEIEPLNCRKDQKFYGDFRLNLLIPSLDEKHVFGGIATALRFFEELRLASGLPARIIVTDAPVILESAKAPAGYVVIQPEAESSERQQIIPVADRSEKTIPVGPNDVFVATAWWTAYAAGHIINWQKETFMQSKPLIYLIQDYEPGFYAWSSRYMLADSTYRFSFPTYAVFNSSLLKDYISSRGYQFSRSWFFEPIMNPVLKANLPKDRCIPKKKSILIYGRPGTDRNAFSLIVYALKIWAENYEKAGEWTVVSAGEPHGDIELAGGVKLESRGKLSLEDYAAYLKDSYIGVSLMVSPHPSYPPLEMAAFGARTITNRFDNKDLALFSENIISLSSCAPENIAAELLKLCKDFDGKGTCSSLPEYTESTKEFGTIPECISKELFRSV